MDKETKQKILNKLEASKAFVPKTDKSYKGVSERLCQDCQRAFSTDKDQKLCLPCWQKRQEKLKEDKELKRQDDIHWGQSWNLAVNLLGGLKDNSKFNDDEVDNIERFIVGWQEWFYKKLKKGDENGK